MFELGCEEFKLESENIIFKITEQCGKYNRYYLLEFYKGPILLTMEPIYLSIYEIVSMTISCHKFLNGTLIGFKDVIDGQVFGNCIRAIFTIYKYDFSEEIDFSVDLFNDMYKIGIGSYKFILSIEDITKFNNILQYITLNYKGKM